MFRLLISPLHYYTVGAFYRQFLILIVYLGVSLTMGSNSALAMEVPTDPVTDQVINAANSTDNDTVPSTKSNVSAKKFDERDGILIAVLCASIALCVGLAQNDESSLKIGFSELQKKCTSVSILGIGGV